MGTVGTLEGHRGLGLSTRLFQRCLSMLASRRVPLSYLLCGEHNVPSYARFGYARSPLVRKIANLRRYISYPIAFALRDVDFGRDTAAWSAMHGCFSGRFNGPAVRSMEYRTRRVPGLSLGTYHLAVDGDGQPLAYMNVGDFAGRLCVYDFGHMPGHQEILDALILAVCDALGKPNVEVEFPKVIASHLPVSRLDEMACCMYRLITPFSVGDRTIASTDELVDALRGEGETSRMLVWDVDDV